MLFNNIPVIAIDQEGTKRMEDAFFVNRDTKEVCIVSIRPNFELARIETIMRALKRGIPVKKPREYFFEKEVTGIPVKGTAEVFVRYSRPPYTYATICLGAAHVVKTFSFEQADMQREDPDIALLYEYATAHGADCLNSQFLVSFLIRQLNESIKDAMQQEQIPYLSHKNGGVSLLGGVPRINRPFRDAVSFVNAAQMWRWLTDGSLYFARRDLASMIGHDASLPKT